MALFARELRRELADGRRFACTVDPRNQHNEGLFCRVHRERLRRRLQYIGNRRSQKRPYLDFGNFRIVAALSNFGRQYVREFASDIGADKGVFQFLNGFGVEAFFCEERREAACEGGGRPGQPRF